MKKIVIGLFAALALLQAGAEELTWLTDVPKAVAKAKEEKKLVMLDFTGSDWCGWCVKLHKEVFDFDSFLDGAEQSFVLVALDYPRGEEAIKKVPNVKRNDELQKKYAIGGFPTVLLMTPDGDAFGKMGYQPGGPEKYLEDVKTTATNGKKTMGEVAALEKKYAAAKGADQEKLVDEALAALGA